MRIRKDINLNFVRKLSFEKEYSIKNDSIYFPKKDTYIGDFTLTDKDETNEGLTIKKTSNYSNYVFDKALPSSFYADKIIRYKPNQFHKTAQYWDSISTSSKKEYTYQLIKSVKNKNKIKQITGVSSRIIH